MLDPAWAPDGARLVYVSSRGGGLDLWSVPAAGGPPELLFDVAGAARAPDWSPDGARLAYSGTVDGKTSIWVLDLDGLEPRRVTRSTTSDLRPTWSPDGRRLAFTRAVAGRSRTWLVGPGAGPARPVAGTEGDLDPDWALYAGQRLRRGRSSCCPTSISAPRQGSWRSRWTAAFISASAPPSRTSAEARSVSAAGDRRRAGRCGPTS